LHLAFYSFHEKVPYFNTVTLPQEYRDLNIGYDCDVQKLEITRKQQANAKEWYEARKNRLTASNFGKVIHRKSAPSVQFLNNVFKIKDIYAPYILAVMLQGMV
jgi:pantothenate kinase